MNLKYVFSYYPAHCNSVEEIQLDIDLIVKSGANVVRMGEFAWDQMEKHEGEYDFTNVAIGMTLHLPSAFFGVKQ